MPTTGQQVQFKAGLSTAYESIQTKDLNTIYFLTDTQQLFVGETEYTRPVQHGADLPDGYLPPDSLFVQEVDDNRFLYYSKDGASWEKIGYFIPLDQGTYGSTTTVPTITVDSNGQISEIGSASIAFPSETPIQVTPAGSGNVITSLSADGHKITATSGITAVEANASITASSQNSIVKYDAKGLVTSGTPAGTAATANVATAAIGDGATNDLVTGNQVKTYVDNAIGQITDFSIDSNGGTGYVSLDALEEAHATGEPGVFYLVVNPDPEANNQFIEYFWSGTAYELAGQFGSVNTADFVTAAANLSDGQLVVGDGTKGVGTLANGTQGQVLKVGADGLEWGTDNDTNFTYSINSSAADNVGTITLTGANGGATTSTTIKPTTSGELTISQGEGGITIGVGTIDGSKIQGDIAASSVDWDNVQDRPTIALTGDVTGSINLATGAAVTTSIAAGSIVNADISASAAIDQSKINGLTTALDSKVDAADNSLDNLTNVTITTPASGQALTYNGTKWVNSALPADTNTTYTFANGANGSFTVTPSDGDAQTVTIGKPATAGTADKVANALTITLNGSATTPATYNGSAALSVDITPAAIGAQAAGNYLTPTSNLDATKLTGGPIPAAVTAVTASAGDNSTAIATTAFVTNAVSSSTLKWGSF